MLYLLLNQIPSGLINSEIFYFSSVSTALQQINRCQLLRTQDVSDDLGMYLRNNMGGILGCALIIWAKMRNHRKAAMLCTGVPYGLMFSMMPMVWDLFLNQKENKASGPTERHSFNTLLQETKSKAEGCTTPIFFFFWKVPSLVAQNPSAQDICVYD